MSLLYFLSLASLVIFIFISNLFKLGDIVSENDYNYKDMDILKHFIRKDEDIKVKHLFHLILHSPTIILLFTIKSLNRLFFKIADITIIKRNK